jgi:membrane protease YdiL (CAAX protease family)
LSLFFGREIVSKETAKLDPLKPLGLVFLVFIFVMSLYDASKSIYASYIAPPALENSELKRAFEHSSINSLSILIGCLAVLVIISFIWTAGKLRNRKAEALAVRWKRTPPAMIGLLLLVVLWFGVQLIVGPFVAHFMPSIVNRAEYKLLEDGHEARVLKLGKVIYFSSLDTGSEVDTASASAVRKAVYSNFAISPKVGDPVELNGEALTVVRTLRDGDKIGYKGRSLTYSHKLNNPKEQMLAAFVLKFLMTLLLIALVALVAGSRLDKGGPDFASIGLSFDNFGAEVLRGLRLYLFFLPFIALIVGATNLAAAYFELNQVPHPLQSMIGDLDSYSLGLAFLVAVIAAPVYEELVFRGLLLPALGRLVGLPGAFLLSAWFFAAAHRGFHSQVPIFALGFFFAYLTISAPKRSVVASITAHMTHNSLSLALFLAAHHASHS